MNEPPELLVSAYPEAASFFLSAAALGALAIFVPTQRRGVESQAGHGPRRYVGQLHALPSGGRLSAVKFTSALLLCSTLGFSQLSSPTELANYVDAHPHTSLDNVWKGLGLDSRYAPCRADTPPCVTEIVSVLRPDQAIVVIGADWVKVSDVYVRYVRAENGWRLEGARMASRNTGNYPRRHGVVKVGGKPFFQIASDRGQNGFAMGQELEEWFDLTEGGFDPVFAYTHEGHFSPFGPAVGREVQATARGMGGLEDIGVDASIFFVGPGFKLPAHYHGIYERHQGDKKYTLKEATAGIIGGAPIPLEDLEGFVGPEFFNMPHERLLIYAMPALEKIASTGDKDAKAWLRSVLEHTKDTPEKRHLLELQK